MSSITWIRNIKERITELCHGHQYGGLFSAGAEALARAFQLEAEDSPHGVLTKLDSKNFFNSIKRTALVDGAALVSPEFAAFVAGFYESETTYAWDRTSSASRSFFPTCKGIVQGEILSAIPNGNKKQHRKS